MKIGIIVYSLSNHTLSVAQKLKASLEAGGHSVALERIEIEGRAHPSNEGAPLKTIPDPAPYDGLVFASPVRGGVLPPPVLRYLEGLGPLDGRQTACLVTGFFPENIGRNQVLTQMREVLASRGVEVCATGSVGWLSLNRRQQIRGAVATLTGAFSR